MLALQREGSGEYCSEITENFEALSDKTRKLFPEVFEDSECHEFPRVAWQSLNFWTPEMRRLSEMHGIAIFTLCEGDRCTISGDLVVPHRARFETERLIRSLKTCKHTRTDTHEHSSHVHYECRVSRYRAGKVVEDLVEIAHNAWEKG